MQTVLVICPTISEFLIASKERLNQNNITRFVRSHGVIETPSKKFIFVNNVEMLRGVRGEVEYWGQWHKMPNLAELREAVRKVQIF